MDKYKVELTPTVAMLSAGINELLDISPQINEAYQNDELSHDELQDLVVFVYQAMLGAV